MGTKDEKYFLEHPEKAEKKTEECINAATKLTISGNMEAMEKILNDPECKAAEKALKQVKKARAAVERKKRMARREAEVALKKQYALFNTTISLEDRLDSRSKTVRDWEEGCLKAVKGRSAFSDCQSPSAGQKIYAKSIAVFKKDIAKARAQIAICEKLARKKELWRAITYRSSSMSFFF